MKDTFLQAVMALSVFSLLFSLSAQQKMHPNVRGVIGSDKAGAKTTYECFKTDMKIRIDGRIDEIAWKKAKPMYFRGIVDGSEPPFPTVGKMLWDDKYLYCAMEFDDPDISSSWAFTESNVPSMIMTASFGKDYEKNPRRVWEYSECQIMYMDRFGKLFLDPDGDGYNYIEFQINPLNNLFHAWYTWGNKVEKQTWGQFEPHVDWNCPGLRSAVWIDGSLNSKADIDRGWSIEMAIPWKSLLPFCKNHKMPVDGTVWGTHLGRVYRTEAGASNEYWTWPILGEVDCHQPDRYGKLIFRNDLRKFTRVFALPLPSNEHDIALASQYGVTDATLTKETPEMFASAKKHNIRSYATLTPFCCGEKDPMNAYAQVMRPDEEALHRQYSGEGLDPNDPFYAVKLQSRKTVRDHAWGGEPPRRHAMYGKHDYEVSKYEVMPYGGNTRILCFNRPEVKAYLEKKIDSLCMNKNIGGIFLDGFGFQNFNGCYCDVCQKSYQDYVKKNGLKDTTQNRNIFNRETLVRINNELHDYIKSKYPDRKTACHVWPVFQPQPLYGKELKIDYVGETAAWFQIWDVWKIRKYSKEITAYPNGVPFIGYYAEMMEFPYKSPERFELELRSMLDGGGEMVMIHSFTDVFDNPELREIILRLFRKK